MVGLWRIFRLKQTIGMQGERPIYSSLDGMQKSRRFQTKGISGSDRVEVFLMPVIRLSSCFFTLENPRLEIRDPIRANSFRLQTGRVTHVLFLTLKGHLSIVSSRIACFKLPGNVKQWAAVYETTVARFHCDCARDAYDTGDSQAYYCRESIIFLLCLRKKIVSSLTNLLKRMDIFSYLIIFYFSSFPSSIFGRKNILKNVL